MQSSSYWTRQRERRTTRRRFLAATTALTAAGLAAACSGSSNNGASSRSNSAAPATSPTSGGAASTAAPSGGSAATGTGVRTATPAANAAALAQAKRGGTLTIGSAGEPRGGFDPQTGFGGEEHQFDYLVFDQIIAYDQGGNLDPSLSLAQKWEFTDPTSLVLTLRSGVKFHDGGDLTATEVKWNLDRILDPATKATPRPDLSAIDKVDAISPTELHIHLSQPSAPLLTAFGDRGGFVLSPSAFEKLGEDQFRRKPTGSGPFMLQDWVQSATMTLQRNPTYWRKDALGQQLPYLQTINFQFIPDATVRSASLESGQVLLLADTPATDVKRLLGNKSYQAAKFVGSSTGMAYINHAFPPLDNLEFRKAVASALDRKTYIQNFLTGQEPVATGLLTPASWGFDPNIKNYSYDIAAAKQHLQASGLPQSAWHIKVQPQSTAITTDEQFWEANLKGAGITIDWGTPQTGGSLAHVYIGQGADGTEALLFSGFTLRVDPDGMMGQFYTQKGAYNSGQAPVPEVEPLVVQARQVYDQAQRKALYSQAQQKGVDMVYSCILEYYSTGYAFASSKVGNLAAYFGGEGKPRYANLWV